MVSWDQDFETTLTRWVHMLSLTRGIVYNWLFITRFIDVVFLSIIIDLFFCWFLIRPGLIDQKLLRSCWIEQIRHTGQFKPRHLAAPIFNGKVVVVVSGWEMGDANITMVLSSSSGARQPGSYATWLSSEVSASGSWKSRYSNNRTILQYTSEMFCTSAMF